MPLLIASHAQVALGPIALLLAPVALGSFAPVVPAAPGSIAPDRLSFPLPRPGAPLGAGDCCFGSMTRSGQAAGTGHCASEQHGRSGVRGLRGSSLPMPVSFKENVE